MGRRGDAPSSTPPLRHPGPGISLLYTLYGEIRTQVGNRGFHSYAGCHKAKHRWVMINPATNSIWKPNIRQGHRERRDGCGSPLCQDMDRSRNASLIRSGGCNGLRRGVPVKSSPFLKRPASPAVWCRRSTRHSSTPDTRRETWSWSWIIQGSAGSRTRSSP